MSAEQTVDIRFECVPLRSVGQVQVPADASPRFRKRCEGIRAAIEKHGRLNTYYLHDGVCQFRLTNDPKHGLLVFAFEGTVATDRSDLKTVSADLVVELKREACSWITEPIVAWFKDAVADAVKIEFDHYIAARDCRQTRARLAYIEFELERCAGFVGMGL